MPGYGLLTGSRGLLPWKWADARLKNSHNYWIVTIRQQGRPHVMVVWGLWMDGRFYFSTGRESRKAKNLDANPNCVIATERADQAVIVEGVADEVGDIELRRRFLRAYEKKYDWSMSSFEEPIMSLKEPVYAVQPRVVFGLDEKKFVNAATRWQFPPAKKSR